MKQETLRVVTIAMIWFTLLHFENFNISGGLHVTQLNIYDGAFIVITVSHKGYSQKNSIVDIILGSKYVSAFWRLFKQFIYSIRLLKSVISLKYFTSFNSSNMLLNI